MACRHRGPEQACLPQLAHEAAHRGIAIVVIRLGESVRSEEGIELCLEVALRIVEEGPGEVGARGRHLSFPGTPAGAWPRRPRRRDGNHRSPCRSPGPALRIRSAPRCPWPIPD